MKMGTLNPTGEIEFANNDLFQVYPNPSNGSFVVNVKDEMRNEKKEMKIFDMMGKQVGTWKLEVGENQIDLSTFTNGIYFIRMNDQVQKIVIQK